MQTPFDPLQYLQSLYLDLDLSANGQIKVSGMWSLEHHQQKKARAVLSTYDKLLRLQLDAPSRSMRPSVRKLLAQGKIEIRDGQYCRPCQMKAHNNTTLSWIFFSPTSLDA